MSDSFSETSFMVEGFTKSELDRLMEIVHAIEDYEDFKVNWDPAFTENQQAVLREMAREHGGPGAMFLRESDYEIWVHSDEHVNAEVISEVLQLWLRMINSDKCVSFECSNTCSKPMIGAFGGFACVVTRHHQFWMNTSSFVSEVQGGLALSRDCAVLFPDCWSDLTRQMVLLDFFRDNPDVCQRAFHYVGRRVEAEREKSDG